MPYPVLPPDPPPIVHYASPEDALTAASTGADLPAPTPSPTATPQSARAVPDAAPASVCRIERSPSSCNAPTLRAADNAVVHRARPLGTTVELSPAQANWSAPGSFELTEIHTDLNPSVPHSLFQPLSPSPSNTSGSRRLVSSPATAALDDEFDAREPLTTLAYRRPQLLQAARQLESDLQRLRLPVLEGLAQQPAPNSTPTDPNQEAESNGQLLIIPSQDDPLPQTLPPETAPDAGQATDVIPSEVEQAVPDGAIPASPDGVPADAVPDIGTPVDGAAPLDPSGTGEVVELDADEQQYDNLRQVFYAEGNVEMRFRGAILNADRLRVNLTNRIAVGEGNVVLTRGEQVLRGDRFVYNFVQQQGDVLNASGELFLPGTSQDFAPALPTDVSAGAINSTTVITNQPRRAGQPGQPAQGVSSPGGITVAVGTGEEGSPGGSLTEGEVRRIRFEAERIDFTADGWQAQNVRLTNDPFSPPELEIRSRLVTFTRESPTRSVIRARNPRVVFDQGLSLPLLQDRVVIDNRRRNPGLFQIGFDEEDRGGLYIQRAFDLYTSPAVQFTVTPQILVQQAFDNGGDFADLANYGLTSRLDVSLGPRTSFRGTAVFTSLNPDDFNDRLRASLRARQQIGTPWGNHELAFEYSYRDRLFNGSLGFQTVQSSLGFVFTSPSILLGDSGIYLSYQAGAQYINARTDREDLLDPLPRENNRVSLTRLQASAALNRGFLLWQGTPLPATAEAGLRYSPNPLTPYVIAFAGLRGVLSNYSSGDTQANLTASVGVFGQFGHFSRDFLDYTSFNLTFSQNIRSGESPFTFDRAADDQVLSFGIVQQVYGPLRIGFQTSVNLERSDNIDTNYILEYSRRTYALTLQYNPVREIGSIGLRISDFNWGTTPEPFSGSGTVSGGVVRSDD
jgi:hypothetical protein